MSSRSPLQLSDGRVCLQPMARKNAGGADHHRQAGSYTRTTRRSLLSAAGLGLVMLALFGERPLAAQTSAPPSTEEIVELPPMIIAEKSGAPPWLYVSVGNVEYLSRCSVGETRRFVRAQLET